MRHAAVDVRVCPYSVVVVKASDGQSFLTLWRIRASTLFAFTDERKGLRRHGYSPQFNIKYFLINQHKPLITSRPNF